MFQFFFEGVFTPLLGILGVIGNLISIKVLSSHHLDMTPGFRHLLKMLAAFDANFLIFTLALFCIGSWSTTYEDVIRPWISPYMLPIVQISLTGSVWTTMAVSLERYLTVCLNYRPSDVSTMCKNHHLIYTLPIVLCSLLFNVPRFFELKTELSPTNVTVYENGTNFTEVRIMPKVVMTKIRENPAYSRDYVMIANSVSLIIIPMLVLIVLNSLIFRKISRATQRHNAISSHQRRDHSVAKMLIIIVVVFFMCHSIRSIINMYECIQITLHGKVPSWPPWLENLIHFNHFALVINSSINILIYCWRDKKFLHILLVTCKIKTQSSTPLTMPRASSVRGPVRVIIQSQRDQREQGSNNQLNNSQVQDQGVTESKVAPLNSSLSIVKLEIHDPKPNPEVKKQELSPSNVISNTSAKTLMPQNGCWFLKKNGEVSIDLGEDSNDIEEEDESCKCCCGGYTSESQSCTSTQFEGLAKIHIANTLPKKMNISTQIPSKDHQVTFFINESKSE